MFYITVNCYYEGEAVVHIITHSLLVYLGRGTQFPGVW